MSTGIRTRKILRHAGIHELRLCIAVISAVECQLNLETLEEFEIRFDIEFIRAGKNRWRGLSVVGNQPATVKGLVQIIFAGKTEGEIETRRHRAVFGRLAEYIAYTRCK